MQRDESVTMNSLKPTKMLEKEKKESKVKGWRISLQRGAVKNFFSVGKTASNLQVIRKEQHFQHQFGKSMGFGYDCVLTRGQL